MGTWQRRVTRIAIGWCIAVPLLALGMYAFNPWKARSWDPRERVIGYAPYRVPSASMAPTLTPGQIVLVNAGYYTRHAPLRGDIVIFISPEDGNRWIKRVIGLPGERVALVDGQLQVDGRHVEEAYVASGNAVSEYAWAMPEVRVPEGQLLLLGDNRDNSLDGRKFGTTPREDLLGKVTRILSGPRARRVDGQ
jgi:signal peptidase I